MAIFHSVLSPSLSHLDYNRMGWEKKKFFFSIPRQILIYTFEWREWWWEEKFILRYPRDWRRKTFLHRISNFGVKFFWVCWAIIQFTKSDKKGTWWGMKKKSFFIVGFFVCAAWSEWWWRGEKLRNGESILFMTFKNFSTFSLSLLNFCTYRLRYQLTSDNPNMF